MSLFSAIRRKLRWQHPEVAGIQAEAPLRAELFTAGQMERHGRVLARSHKLSRGRCPERLLPRLAENEQILIRCCQLLQASTTQQKLTPAGEWLLDNYYLIEEQIYLIRQNLPKEYGRGLPRLNNPAQHGIPRVYDIALEAIAHGDGHWDADSFSRFVGAYQQQSDLNLGELWALPIMLRLALIENLRRIARHLTDELHTTALAMTWAERLVQVSRQSPDALIQALAELAQTPVCLSASFVAELTRRLQGKDPGLSVVTDWLALRLREQGMTLDSALQQHAQSQAVSQLSVSNSINSLRALEQMNWPEFVETMSVSEQILRSDPAAVYARMDFATRDRYRHQLERLARRARVSEPVVARRCVELAQQAGARYHSQDRRLHVGYYLIGDGQALLTRELGIRSSLARRSQQILHRHALPAYLLAVSGFALLAVGVLAFSMLTPHASDVPTFFAAVAGSSPFAMVSSGLLLVCAFLAFSQLAVQWVNELLTRTVTPSHLPKMDFSHGLPPEYRSLVVVPMLLRSPAQIDAAVAALEVRYLANPDPYLHFALLTDFTDAPQPTLPEDEGLLNHVRQHIQALNQRINGDSRGSIFFLFHRERRWNEREGCWMGYERKRGKLAALNAFLLGQDPDAFDVIAGRRAVLSNIRYVITLDLDTQLPPGSATQLIGTLAHPLNQAVYDPICQRVVAGYCILQPRIAEQIPEQGLNAYLRVCATECGLDPYTRTVSDVYQDLFGEGSFIGKGIYDLAVFERVLRGRWPENQVLSHDLLEGCYARSGLVSDVALFEQSPDNYLADVARRRRWVRGDWQLLPWLRRRVRTLGGSWEDNTLSALSRWKLLDNLRRSLTPFATLMLLVGGLLLTTPVSVLWIIGLLWLSPALLALLLDMVLVAKEVSWWQYSRLSVVQALRRIRQQGLQLLLLPFEALFHLSAACTALWRMFASHRRMLEWTTSEAQQQQAPHLSADFYRQMWPSWTLALLLVPLVALSMPANLGLALAIAAGWLLTPWLMARLSQPVQITPANLSREQQRYLRQLSRETWGFFETFVSADDHFLPPDNYQEVPDPVVAHRTSPTNIGLSLLANLTAYDFGYIPRGELLARTRQTLDTLEQLGRYRGHFYNWYDTQTLRPLYPRYISTVDSGNLAGHLLILRRGLLALREVPPNWLSWQQGLMDTLQLLVQALGERASPVAEALTGRLQDVLSANDAELEQSPLAYFTRVQQLAAELNLYIQDTYTSTAARRWSQALVQQTGLLVSELEGGSAEQQQQQADIVLLAQRLEALADMDFEFLFDPARQLLRVGYNLDSHQFDLGHYDLLQSEARLSYFLAVARRQIPLKSWFNLGRLLTVLDGRAVLASWSGSMFEYLMPQLVMPSYQDTLISTTCHHAVLQQMHYGRQTGLPWGVSESGYNRTDAQFNYQYRAFGVPGLGLKRGLAEDRVVAPYATMMALMLEPQAALHNLQRLQGMGARGGFGFYEALDFTPSRLNRGEIHALIRSYMAHHQGMGFLALSHALLGSRMPQRFSAEPLFKATQLLLQERMPKVISVYVQRQKFEPVWEERPDLGDVRRQFGVADLTQPQIQLLSNSRYHVLLSQSGAGYSRWHQLALTRWRTDATTERYGLFCYLREVNSARTDSVTCQPFGRRQELAEAEYRVIFSESRAEFSQCLPQVSVQTEIVVSPEDDVELRRIRLTNHSYHPLTLELTTYAEVVLAPLITDELHPAFSNLFMQTEIVAGLQTLLCHRRARTAHERNPWLFHQLNVQGAESEAISYETDRMKFIGRGRSAANPQALEQPLTNSHGAVLDPIVAIRRRITLAPQSTASADLLLGVAPERESCLLLAHKYRDPHLADRVEHLAWTHSQVFLHQLNINDQDAALFNQLAGRILYPDARLRAEPAILQVNRRGQSDLWPQAISGDHPILLVQVQSADGESLVRQLLQAHAYLRHKGFIFDLVIANQEHSGYRQELQTSLGGLLNATGASEYVDRAGGVYLRAMQNLTAEEQTLLQAVAVVILDERHGSLAEQLASDARSSVSISGIGASATLGAASVTPVTSVPITSVAALSMTRRANRVAPQEASAEPDITYSQQELQFFNGLGGFSRDGREYILLLDRQRKTPVPWSNILANPHFGSVISESGQAYTWYQNAHEYRLTPWHNDPVTDRSGEALYIRDMERGDLWSPTPQPCAGEGEYRTRHGFGYSVFEHQQGGIESSLRVFVDRERPVKFWQLRLVNRSAVRRHLQITGYAEWIAGDLKQKTALHVVSWQDAGSRALLARNTYNHAGDPRTLFFDVSMHERSVCNDRQQFLGPLGQESAPLWLAAEQAPERLPGINPASCDPCAALQVNVHLLSGEARELVFVLGAEEDETRALALLQQLHGHSDDGGMVAQADRALAAVHAFWRNTLGAVQVSTPEPELDVLLNGWLLYQTLACRVEARSGYYQSGGAFGFRDQLQDCMALVHAAPSLLRQHLLTAASRQFIEGDVQHWWHPPLGQGVRTRCSDDYLWLPYVLCHYVNSTSDLSILRESVSYLAGRELKEGEESYYDAMHASGQSETLYQHAVRALMHGLRFGEHGLPLMGSGDWNDGMDQVGSNGRGESIWLGFFLYDVLQRFAELAERCGDTAIAEMCHQYAEPLQQNLEQHGWDGQWYRRAYFDNGSMLGAAINSECRIDAIAQSWSVLSGAGALERSRLAMHALNRHLVKRPENIIQLLDPPFDRAEPNPGYIRGYVPGVRENGGQYTHAAVWSAMAFAALGDKERAWELTRMLNPLNHGKSLAQVAQYKVEPYVAAADIYAVAPHTGRGGWTWYTGSAGWMYRLMSESLLGIKRSGTRLLIEPCLPEEWNRFSIRYRYHSAEYHIEVEQVDNHSATGMTVDGIDNPQEGIQLQDDGKTHQVQLRICRENGQPDSHKRDDRQRA